MSAAARLRQLLADRSNLLVCPGVYDGLTARIAIKAGFECLYMTGAGTTISRLGMPDLGIATLNDMRDNAAMIASLDPSIPVIADADTGYGGPLMVGRTVAQYITAGVAGLHLEDQVQTKRCGHLNNKEIVDEDVFIARIQAAINMREEVNGDIVIIARTDSLQSLGYEAAVRRLKRSIAIGADVAFIEGVPNKEVGRKVCQELYPTPVLFNHVPGGVSPNLSVDELQELGFRVMILSGIALSATYSAFTDVAQQLKKTGIVVENKDTPSIRDIFDLCGMQEAVEFDVHAGGTLYAKGV